MTILWLRFFRARGKTFNFPTEVGDGKEGAFEGEMAILFALMVEGDTLGVPGLWRRRPDIPRWILQHREFSVTLELKFLPILLKIQENISPVDKLFLPVRGEAHQRLPPASTYQTAAEFIFPWRQ